LQKIRERLAVGKGRVNKNDIDKFYLKNVNEGELKEQYQVTIKKRRSTLENLGDEDINTVWEPIRENIKISAKSVSAIVKQSIINHGLMRKVQNWLIEGSRLNYSGCRTQV
jgi:hypothetical protein